jgi:hypothetical protein
VGFSEKGLADYRYAKTSLTRFHGCPKPGAAGTNYYDVVLVFL